MLATNTTAGPTLVEVTEEHSDVPFTVVYTPGTGMELSLASLKEIGDDIKTPDLCQKIHAVLHPLGVKNLFAPTPFDASGKPNAAIIEPTALSKSFRIGKGMYMFRNYKEPADGSFLRNPGDTGIFSLSGCGVIVATMGDLSLFAHAARDSLIDRRRVLTGQSSRRNESVVDSIIGAFTDFGYEKLDIRMHMRVWMFYFIRPEDLFDEHSHPQHGPYNSKVGPYVQSNFGVECMHDDEGVRLDLPVIAAAQFKKHGLSGRHINLEHRYLPEGMPHTRNGGGRALLAVIRR